MSVRVGDRSEGKLAVLNKARELKKYSLTLLKSDKIFPKSTRWLFAYPIANEVRNATTYIRKANSIYAIGQEDFAERRLNQIKAHESIDSLYDLVEDAYNVGYISGERCEYWTKLIKETDDTLKAWMKYDKYKGGLV